jgi:hypothetical protein
MPSAFAMAETTLIRHAKTSNVIDRKRILSRHCRPELAPLCRANAGAFQRLVGALNDFADWLAIRDEYKNVRIFVTLVHPLRRRGPDAKGENRTARLLVGKADPRAPTLVALGSLA